MLHHFGRDFIYNMDHMRILGTEFSSATPSQTKKFQKVETCP